MSNQQTVIMVPAKAVKQDLKTETNTIVYMPLATTKNPGVVKIGEGLKVDADGLLTFDKNEITILQIAKNGEIIQPDENKIVNIVLNKNDVGLNNVDNTSDANKPVSIYQQQALDTKINKHAGVENRNKYLYVGPDGNVTYKNVKAFAVYNNNKLIGQDSDSFNFSSLFNITSSDGKNINIDGADDLKNAFKAVTYDAATGILAFTKLNGTVLNVDLPLELIIKSGHYDDVTSELVLVLANDDEIRIPVAQLMNTYYADDVTLELKNIEGRLTFNVKDGSIDSAKLADNSVIDSKIVSVDGNKITGAVAEAVRATNDENGNNISNTYRKMIDSYNKTETDVLLENKANKSLLPTITRLVEV